MSGKHLDTRYCNKANGDGAHLTAREGRAFAEPEAANPDEVPSSEILIRSPRPRRGPSFREVTMSVEALLAEAPAMESGTSAALSGHVLVLNQDYQALTITSVQRAIILLLLQKAELIEAESARFVRSPSRRVPWPSIVRLKAYVRVPYKRVLLTRKNVIRRDGNRCQYCGSPDRITIDHVMPRSRGGKDTWTNLVAACVPCNNRKGNNTPEEAGMTLARAPFRPSYVMYIRDFVGSLEHTWKPYLFLA